MIYKAAAASEGIKLPDNFAIDFTSLWEMSDTEKATVSKTTSDAVLAAYDGGVIGRQTTLRELRQSSRATGIFTNITEEMIAAADDEVMPPMGEEQMNGLMGGNEGEGDETRPDGQAGKIPGGAKRRVPLQLAA